MSPLLGFTPTTNKQTFAKLGHNLTIDSTRTFRIDGLDEDTTFADCVNCGSTFYVGRTHVIGSDAASFCTKTVRDNNNVPQLNDLDNDAHNLATLLHAIGQLTPGNVMHSEPWLFADITITCHVANHAYSNNPVWYYYMLNGVSVGNIYGLTGTLMHMFEHRARQEADTEGLLPWIVVMQLFGDKEQTWTFNTTIVPALSYHSAVGYAFDECKRIYPDVYNYSRRPIIVEVLGDKMRPAVRRNARQYSVGVVVDHVLDK